MPPRCHRAQQSAGRISAESSMAKCYPSAGRDDHWIPSPRCGWPLGKHLQFASKSPPFLHSFFHWKFPSIHISLAYLFSIVRVAGGIEQNGGPTPPGHVVKATAPCWRPAAGSGLCRSCRPCATATCGPMPSAWTPPSRRRAAGGWRWS